MEHGRILVLANCGLFVAFGLCFALAPERIALLLTDSSPATPSAITDMRATYGGMALGLATIFWLCARKEAYVRLGVQGVLAVMVALALTRTLGMLVDTAPNIFMFVLLAAEGVMAVLALAVLRDAKKKQTL
jgi:hypothetical protein